MFVTDPGYRTASWVASIVYLKASFWVMGEIGSCLVIVTIMTSENCGRRYRSVCNMYLDIIK